MSTFDNVEVYVRIADYGFEGDSLRFATVNEEQALTYFSDDMDSGEYAPEGCMEELRVYVGGKLTDKWEREKGKWVKGHGINKQEYGVVTVTEKDES